MGQLLFTPGQINFADLAGGFSQIVDPTFSSDQLLGSFIRVTPLDYGGVTTAGLHYFSGGTLTIDNGTATQVGDQVYLTANFDIYFLNDTVENGSRVIDDFTILLTPTINNTIGSNLLDELSATAFGGEGLFLDFFFKSSGTYEGVDLVAITKGFTENGFIEATYYLGPNGTVPEPPTLYLIASVLAGFRMCRWRYCG